MRILTTDNVGFDVSEIPDSVSDLRFCVLDNSNPKDVDYFFIPLIFLESFNSPALVLKIGDNIIQMPVDWQVLIGDPELGDLEVLPLTSINDRGFSAFVFNPISDFRPSFFQIEIVDIFQDVRWYFPKLRAGQLLAIPLEENTPKPRCVYFVKEISKSMEIVNYSLAW